jgi:hypothetical protein
MPPLDMVCRWTPRRTDPIYNSLSIRAEFCGSGVCGGRVCRGRTKRRTLSESDMRTSATIVALLFAATATAASQTPASPKPTPPRAGADTALIGTYDLEITTDDGTMTGALAVRRGPEGLTGDLTVGGNKPALKSFLREGDHYVITGGHGTFTVVYTLRFSRDSLDGNFKMSTGLIGKVLGALRK